MIDALLRKHTCWQYRNQYIDPCLFIYIDELIKRSLRALQVSFNENLLSYGIFLEALLRFNDLRTDICNTFLLNLHT